MEPDGIRFEVLENAEAVAQRAVHDILFHAAKAIAARGLFRILLAGGRTPTAAYRLLARAAADWTAWEIYFGDERCAPVGSDDRNDVAARRTWLEHVAIATDRVFAIPAELGAEQAAEVYAKRVALALPFDLVLLGVGEDGHTASLFPGREVAAGALVVPVHDAPKPPPDRVSLTPKALADTAAMLVLVTGAGKAGAVAAWRSGGDLPIAKVAAAGRARVLMDRAAANKVPARGIGR
jgi:6-phosphogluconolactonase